MPLPTRVLIVEADSAFADALTEIVGSVPDHVVLEVATTAEAGLAAAGRLRPDVLITDVHPAGTLSGFALMWQISESCDCKVIGLLSFEDDVYREATAKHGAVACLVKECVAEELPALLQSLRADTEGGPRNQAIPN